MKNKLIDYRYEKAITTLRAIYRRETDRQTFPIKMKAMKRKLI